MDVIFPVAAAANLFTGGSFPSHCTFTLTCQSNGAVVTFQGYKPFMPAPRNLPQDNFVVYSLPLNSVQLVALMGRNDLEIDAQVKFDGHPATDVQFWFAMTG